MHELLAVRLGDAQQPSRFVLRMLIEAQDALAPQLAQGVEPQPRVGEPRRASLPAPGQRLVSRDTSLDAALDPPGRDRRGRIDPQPAVALDPDFVPGVGVALAQDPVVGEAIERSALIAGDDAGRDAGGAHQQPRTRRRMPAEASPVSNRNSSTEFAAERGRLKV